MEAGWVQVAVAVGALVVAMAGLAATIMMVFYTARKDARDARAETQKSIERSIERSVGPRLDALRSDAARMESKLDRLSDRVERLGDEVATMRGRQQERDRVPESTDFTQSNPQLSERTH